MSLHTYPWTAVIGDYSRSVAGLGVSLVPFAVAPSRPLVTYLFGAMIAAFVVYGARTAMRHFTCVEVGDAGIATNLPTPRGIAWTEVDTVRLRFFSSRRNRSRGWFQLVVGGAGRRIALDSSITDFHHVVTRVAAAAEANRLSLDAATADNIAALTGAAEPPAP